MMNMVLSILIGWMMIYYLTEKMQCKMFREIEKILPDITWAANNGLIAAGIDSNMMDAIRDSGCIGFKIGLESGNEKVLREVHKPTTLSNFYKFSKLSKGYPEIFVGCKFYFRLSRREFLSDDGLIQSCT